MYSIRVKPIIGTVFGLLSLAVTLYAIGKFVLFLSDPKEIPATKKIATKNIVRRLINNTIWLVVFILQHSFQKHDVVKRFWAKIGFLPLERAAYNLVSSLVLLVSSENINLIA